MLTFNFNLNTVFKTMNKAKQNKKNFEPLFYINDEMPSPGEIRKTINNLSRCSNCHFLIFDNYWDNKVEKNNIKLCPTCGHKI